MFIINWFWDVLAQLGWYKPLSKRGRHVADVFSPEGLLHKNAKILFLGLDNAGKTVRFVEHLPLSGN